MGVKVIMAVIVEVIMMGRVIKDKGLESSEYYDE